MNALFGGKIGFLLGFISGAILSNVPPDSFAAYTTVFVIGGWLGVRFYLSACQTGAGTV